eukprot:3881051-Alexandrium_andersonii.AAC.1
MLQAFEPGTAQAQERPQNWSTQLLRGSFCAAVRADSESDDERGRSGGSEGGSEGSPRGLRG